MENRIRALAIYLPQFHPIPENDEWWGKGFTEWTNVVRAKPLFKSHYQPRIPSDLGFYDLRLAESRQAQADMAKEFGLHGFCYYHYWFKGKQLLEGPFSQVLNQKKPDFPFCLCWANETWSRRWLGEEKEILLKQEYSDDDDLVHAEYLANCFSEDRYITVNGRPLFIIYKPGDLPDVNRTIETIKEASVRLIGKEPYLVGSNSHLYSKEKLLGYGFDAILNFRPQLGALPYAFVDKFLWKRLLRNVMSHKLLNGKLKVYSYEEALKRMRKIEYDNFDNTIPVVFPGWDNSPRRGKNGIILTDNTLELFKNEIIRVKRKISESQDNPNIIVFNAWNEWAEGNHLEPDQKNGLEYLKCVLSQMTS